MMFDPPARLPFRDPLRFTFFGSGCALLG